MSSAVETRAVQFNDDLGLEKPKTAKKLKKEAVKAAKLAKFHEKTKKTEVKTCQVVEVEVYFMQS